MKKVILFLAIVLFACTVVAVSAEIYTPAEYAAAETVWKTRPNDIEECTGISANLLTNGSFEGDYATYIPIGGHPDCPWGECQSAQLANGWTPFWISHNPELDRDWENFMPEYKPANEIFIDPPRVRTGERAQVWFTFFATHDAGIYQRVSNLDIGTNYCFSVWGHGWSSNRDDDAYTDLDDHGFLNMRVGIDPTGGTDWQSSTVIWTDEVTQYDEYGVFRVEAAAEANNVTVFMNSDGIYATKHMDVYWDDAKLVALNAPATPVTTPTEIPATTTATPTPNATETPVVTVSPTPYPTPTPGGPPTMLVGNKTIDLETVAGSGEVLATDIMINIFNAPTYQWFTWVQPFSEFTPTLSASIGDITDEVLTINVDSGGMAEGTYRAYIRVDASEPSIMGGENTVTITLTVLEPAAEMFVVGGGGFSAETDTPITTTLTISLNKPALTWSATADPDNTIPILFADTEGDRDQALTLTFDTTGIDPGTYTPAITIAGSDTAIAPQTVEFEIELLPSSIPPTLIFDIFNFQHTTDVSTPTNFSSSIPILMANADNLFWEATIDPTSDFTPALNQTSGSDQDHLVYTIDSNTLSLGTHTALIYVSIDDETFTDDALPIHIEVTINQGFVIYLPMMVDQ